MNSKAHSDDQRSALADVHSDCRQWRQLVKHCLHVHDHVPPATDEKYRVIHGRILASCRNLAEQQSFPESRRQIIRQLDELLRPWSSAKVLAQASPDLVEDLVKKETSLEDWLKHKRRGIVVQRLGRLLLVGCAAGLAGIVITLLMKAGDPGSGAVAESIVRIPAAVSDLIRRMDFSDQFAIAVLCSWLLGTWLLSHVYKS